MADSYVGTCMLACQSALELSLNNTICAQSLQSKEEYVFERAWPPEAQSSMMSGHVLSTEGFSLQSIYIFTSE